MLPRNRSVSAPVSDGHRFASLGTYARRRWIVGASRQASRSKIRAPPDVGRISPSSSAIVVDFPAPFGPR